MNSRGQAPSHAAQHRWLPWLMNGAAALALRRILPYTLEASGERYRYYAMSQLFPIQHCPSFHCFRVLPPLFASLLPLQTADAFIVTGLVFQLLAGVVLWHLAVRLSRSTRVAWLTVAWYWATWAPILTFSDPLLITDPVQAFWSFAALYLLLERRDALALALLVAGAAIKESVLLIPMMYAAYVLLAGERSRPSIARLATFIVLPLAAWTALRLVLRDRFGYEVGEQVAYVRQTYFFGVWLKNLAPWPANVRLAALYIFGSYGAGWVFGAAGLRWSNRQQRALTVASIPAMLFLALYQVPDRALASFPYAVLIPAATFTSRLPTPLAYAVLLVNAAFTIRMNTTVVWLPRTTVLLGALLALIVVSLLLAVRRSRARADEAVVQRDTDVRALAWAALAVCAVVACQVTWSGLTSPPPLRLALPTDVVPIADDDGATPGVAMAPDDRRLVFVGVAPSRRTSLYLRELTSAFETVLEGTGGASAPFWSPDGARIGFFADGKLKAITLETHVVGVLADAPHPRGGAWSRQNVILFAPEASGGLYQVSSRGGSPQAVTAVGQATRASHRWPSFLPDGTRFLFVVSTPAAATPDVYLGSLSSRAIKRVLDDGKSPAYASPGLLLFARGDIVWAQAFDARRETTLGGAVEISPRVAWSMAFERASFSLGDRMLAAGTHTARSALPRPEVTSPGWFDRRGRPEGEDVPGLFNRMMGRERPEEVWRAAWSRVLRGGAWAADGSRFAYAEFEGKEKGTTLYEGRPAGAERRVLAKDVPMLAVATSWSPDGSTVLLHAEPHATHGSWDIWALTLPNGRAAPLINSPADEVQAQFSPDGQWIAYASNETGRYEVFVQPYPATGSKWQVSTEGGTQPRWRADGRELFFVVGDRFLVAAPIDTAPAFRAGPPQELFTIGLPALDPRNLFVDYAVSPDGQHILVNRQQGDPPSGQIGVWVNWRRGLT